MKKIAVIFMLLLTIISCATVPTGPLAPGELRLTSLKAHDKIKAGVAYDVVASFQANDPVEIIQGCFYWQVGSYKEGPYCFHIREFNPDAKTFKVNLITRNPKYYTLIGYVEYRTSGNTKNSNEISTALDVR